MTYKYIIKFGSPHEHHGLGMRGVVKGFSYAHTAVYTISQ